MSTVQTNREIDKIDDKNMCLGHWSTPGTSVMNGQSDDPMEGVWEDKDNKSGDEEKIVV